jgi:Tfp pilus assembly protein PilF
VESEKAFKRGVKAQRGGNLSLAITEYQAAVKADPANYDAYYNLGLAALERGDARFSLWAYEIALALKPNGEDARYNFGLALKAGGYWQDAGEQFQKLLVENPSDARAQLSLANLYAQQLQQPALARDHYQRVLEINPKHPEAAKIRYWLAANP